MAHTVENRIQNPASRLRAALDALESASIAPSAGGLEALLLQLDETRTLLAELGEQGVDLRAEQVRWDNLVRRLESRPQLIANAARGLPGGLPGLRTRLGRTPDDAAWWRADLVHARRRRRLVSEIVALVVGVPLALGLIYWAVTYFFPPDPAAVATLGVEAEVDKAQAAGDLAPALVAADAALAAHPAEGSLAVWVAVLANELGQGERAADAENQAEEIYGEASEDLWLVFSDHYARLGDAAASIDYAQRILQRNPESAAAWYHQGRAAMLLGDRGLALQSLERASTLANDSSPELAVNARFLYADLLRQPDMIPGEPISGTLPASAMPAPTALPAPIPLSTP